MVRRYPHTIKFSSTPNVTDENGLYTDGVSDKFESEGRYENHTAGFQISVDGKRVKFSNWILCPLFDNSIDNHTVIVEDENGIELYSGQIIISNKLQTHYEIYCK